MMTPSQPPSGEYVTIFVTVTIVTIAMVISYHSLYSTQIHELSI